MKKFKRLSILLLPLVCGSCASINDTIYAMQENQAAIIRSTASVEESIRLSAEANRLVRENLQQLERLNQKLREANEEQSGKGA